MIKHQRQGPMECVPTSIGMLLGIPKDDVITAAKPPGFQTWAGMMGHPEFWEATCLLLDAGFGDGTGKRMLTAHMRRNPPVNACPTGRGLILIQGPTAHCVAFEHGLIYDPEHDKPMYWNAWRRATAAWRVHAVITL